MARAYTRRQLIKAAAATAALGLAGSSGWLLLADARGPRAREPQLEPLPELAVGGLIRPPGALPEAQFRATCISCGACQGVCRVMGYDAITMAGPRHGRNLGTPHLPDMRDFPCGMCMECPGQCPSGALRPLEKPEVKMGMAIIDLGLCFGWNGDVCLSCSKVCPLGALVFDFNYGLWGNQPFINDRCTGCGLCVKYCPLGGSAIKVVTLSAHKAFRDQYNRDLERLLKLDDQERFNLVYEQNLPVILERGRIIEREFR